MKTPVNIFWFRRDLRLEDNHGLFVALTSGFKVLPIFIYDSDILGELAGDDARVTFFHQLILDLNKALSIYDTSVATFYGRPTDVFRKLADDYQIQTVYTNHDYEPYAVARDKNVESVLTSLNIKLQTYKDQVIFEKSEVVKPGGDPYVVFTPYSNRWKTVLREHGDVHYPSEQHLNNFVNHDVHQLELADIGFQRSVITPPVLHLSDELIASYLQTRNFPGKPTSLLGVHLRFGSVSIRKVVRAAMLSAEQTFLNELIWREFFMQILWHFPHTVNSSFRPKYDFIPWRNNEEEYKKWCDGMTGYPLVDAGMRELNATGFMHNRVRMIAAGFLCKHLLIDRRWGETYFANKLLDYEQASNVGNWQWAAGSGVDAAPYFRIFNPNEQLKKFDPKMEYVRKWVPEIDEFSYPQPIVDHKFARERCIATYKKALNELQ
ncbi:MAG TPA: deoxyribodipyrimidine photo-lyase [Flavobacterium sp.]|jgi:deoxyribodipyrimidine photo-lyase